MKKQKKREEGVVSPKQSPGGVLELRCDDVNPTTSPHHLMDALLFKHWEGATKSIRFSWIPTASVFSVNTGINRLFIEICVVGFVCKTLCTAELLENLENDLKGPRRCCLNFKM